MATTCTEDSIIMKKVKEFKTQIETWKKMLYSRMEENILMKNKLGALLKNKFVQNDLDKIEEFHNKFIREDAVTNILRSDIDNIEFFCYDHVFKNNKARQSFEKTMKQLNNDMMCSENHFYALTTSFDDFINKNDK